MADVEYSFGLDPANTSEYEIEINKNQPNKITPHILIFSAYKKSADEKSFMDILKYDDTKDEKFRKTEYGDTASHMADILVKNHAGIDISIARITCSKSDNVVNPKLPDKIMLGDKRYTHLLIPYVPPNYKNLINVLGERWETTLSGNAYLVDGRRISEIEENYKNTDSVNTTVFWTDKVCDAKDQPKLLAATVSKILETSNSPAKPHTGKEVDGVEAVQTEMASQNEREKALKAGLTTFTRNAGKVFIGRVRTLAKDLSRGDEAYKHPLADLCARSILELVDHDEQTFISKYLSGKVVSTDESLTGLDVATPKRVFAEMIDRHEKWKEWLWVQDPRKQYAKKLRIRVASDGDNFEITNPIHFVGTSRGSHTKIRYYKGN